MMLVLANSRSHGNQFTIKKASIVINIADGWVVNWQYKCLSSLGQLLHSSASPKEIIEFGCLVATAPLIIVANN